MDSRITPSRRFDITPAFALAIVAFVAVTLGQFASGFGDASRGLLIFERAQKDLYVNADLLALSASVRVDTSLAQRLREQTVLVATRTSMTHQIEGTGVIVGARPGELAVLTARHVVDHPGQRSVIFATRDASVVRSVAYDARDDLALLWVPVLPGSYARSTIARTDFSTGQRFVVMGHPGEREWAATPGIAEHHAHVTLLYCPRCDRGDSGAGAFDMHGKLHGLVTRKLLITAPSARDGRPVTVTAFSTVRADRIRAFLDRTLR